MNKLVYPGERTLSALTLVIGLAFWILIIVGTVGVALIGLLLGFIAYLFAQSALIAWIKGNGVKLDERQFPDLHAQFVTCCDTLQIKKRPQAYVLNGNGAINAFATRFLGHEYVVLNSNTVDAMREHPDGVAFYIGHELGHLRMGHLTKHLLRWPGLWLPLIGAAYSRAKESTCDRHGLACSSSPDNAAIALGALAAGGHRWRQLDVAALRDQAKASSGFWMSFHELLSPYPWITKRVVRVTRDEKAVPGRHPLSYVPAVFIPYAGRLGGGFGLLMLVYIVGVLAAVALPAYQAYVTKAKVAEAISQSQPARDALVQFYTPEHHVPQTLAEAGIPQRLANGSTLVLDSKEMALTVTTPKGNLVFRPRVDEHGNLLGWDCGHEAPLRANQVPAICKDVAAGGEEPTDPFSAR
ncbi:MAG: M48 family metalloprotease [Caulobacter sp.]|nr:M48 family metalloprotease [Vitreoscilla sp.]